MRIGGRSGSPKVACIGIPSESSLASRAQRLRSRDTCRRRGEHTCSWVHSCNSREGTGTTQVECNVEVAQDGDANCETGMVGDPVLSVAAGSAWLKLPTLIWILTSLVRVHLVRAHEVLRSFSWSVKNIVTVFQRGKEAQRSDQGARGTFGPHMRRHLILSWQGIRHMIITIENPSCSTERYGPCELRDDKSS